MVRKISFTYALVAMLTLAACASVPNVVGNNTEAGAESAYIAAATLESGYLHLSFCAAGFHFSIAAPCKETVVIRQVKANDRTAHVALLSLRQFNKANPGNQVAVATYIAAALGAIRVLRNTIPGA